MYIIFHPYKYSGFVFLINIMDVHQLGQQHAAGGAAAEGHDAQHHDEDGLQGQEQIGRASCRERV